MNDRLTSKILSEARASLEPTRGDRDRMHRKVMGAVGAATVIAAAGASAAKVAGGAAATGIPLWTVSAIKLTVGGILLAGAIAVGVAGEVDFFSKTPKQAQNVSQTTRVHRGPKPTPQRTKSADVPLRCTQDGADKTVCASQLPEDSVQAVAVQPMKSDDSEVSGNNRATETVAQPPKRHRPYRRARTTTTVPNDNGLLKEIAMIREASRLIQRQKFSAAARLLDQYSKAFPGGSMRQERDGLMIEALCGAQMVEQARNAYRAFENRYGKPPLMFRVDEQCTATQKSNVGDAGK